MSAPQQPQPMERDMFAGATAAVTAVGILHPIDTLKTNLHLVGRRKGLDGIGDLVLSFRFLYKGFGIIVVGSALASALRMAVFEQLKLKYFVNELRKEETDRTFGYTLCSCAAGIVSSVIYVPFESTKQRLQSGMYSSALECIRDGWQSRGIRSFYLGWTATIIRDLPFTIIELTLYERFKDWWRMKKASNTQSVTVPLSPMESLVTGCLAAGIGGFLTCPLDVVKTRVMTSSFQVPLRNVRWVVADILKKEGIPGFFRGVVPRVVQLGLMGSIFFTTMETCRNWWNRWLMEYDRQALGL